MQFLFLSPPSILPPLDPRVLRDIDEHIGDLNLMDAKSTLVLMIRGTKYLLGSAVLMPRSSTEVREMHLGIRGKCLELREFQIFPRYRGKGYGQLFLQSVISHAEKNKTPLKLDVWRSNKTAIHCYEKAGFCKFPMSHPATQWINTPDNLFKMYNIHPHSTKDKACVYIFI